MSLTRTLLEDYVKKTVTSKRLYERACKVLPSGSTRETIFYKPYPIYAVSGIGSQLVDVDGNEYIDYFFNASSLILGHSHSHVMNAVRDQLENGIVLGTPSELEIELAERLVERFPSIKKVRFTSTGTEAVMNALRVARGYSKKDKFVMFEGHYHGSIDDAQSGLGLPYTTGFPKSAFENRIVVSSDGFFTNNVEELEKALKRHLDETGAVIMEPNWGMKGLQDGLAEHQDFLKTVREITSKYGILLIFDEVKTGLRNAPGGAQQYFGVIPDITVLGKNLGGGFPLGAFGASDEVMKLYEHPIDPSLEKNNARIFHAGTMNTHPIAMRAGIVTIDELIPEIYEKMDKLGSHLRRGLTRISADLGIKLRVFGSKSVFQVLFIDKQMKTSADLRKADSRLMWYFRLGLCTAGVYLAPGGFPNISAATTGRDVERTLQIVQRLLENMKPLIRQSTPAILD